MKFTGSLSKDGVIVVASVEGEMNEHWSGKLWYSTDEEITTKQYTLTLTGNDSKDIVFYRVERPLNADTEGFFNRA